VDKEFDSVKEGYDFIAKFYEEWKWQRFWKYYENPVLEKWSRSLAPGEGLDAGTGNGSYLRSFLSKGSKVVAIDLSPEMLNLCRITNQPYIDLGMMQCIELDLLNLKSLHRKFDWIICSRVLTHLVSPGLVFQIFSDILNPSGECFISDIHPRHRYDKTGIRINGEKFYIKTYKHDIADIERDIMNNHFDITDRQEVTRQDLADSPVLNEFPELQFQVEPVFYNYFIKKRK
jgi:2-polyprenyl-3-methyl-5-hydroxy-6-metoxy-1,4-benzoquinol methylase